MAAKRNNKKGANKAEANPYADLWGSEGGTKAITKPQPVETSKGWSIDAEMIPAIKGDVRPRAVPFVKPNKRAAVAIPNPGQSYNPDDTHHQAAMLQAAIKIQERKNSFEKFARMMTNTGDVDVKFGALVNDKNWEAEDVNEGKRVLTEEESEARNAEKKKIKKVVRVKKVVKDSIRKSAKHKRQPDRERALSKFDKIDSLVADVNKKVAKREARVVQKKQLRADGQQIMSFGRYHHTPLVMDVATSDKLVGSLRHMTNDSAAHAALDRVKSLEERNLIPARMRHTFNKRRVLKARGQVSIRREAMGRCPDPDDHSLV